MHALRRRRRERENRRADIAAELHIMPESAKEMCDQRRCRRLAVGAGDRNERRLWGNFRAFAAEELMSAVNSVFGSRARSTLQCGSGWVRGTPGDKISALKSSQSASLSSLIVRPSARAASQSFS